MFVSPKEEALCFENAPAAMSYSRTGARKFWQKVSVGTKLTGPRGRALSLGEGPCRASLNFEGAAARLDELLQTDVRALSDAERQEIERLHAYLVRWERVR